MRHLRDLFGSGTSVGIDDGQLLSRYALTRDEEAFEILVARHGPMVLATCRAVLKHQHDVEDAFQVTFLLLARKARSVRSGDALGGWLHRVAYRAAIQAAAQARRRRRGEAEAAMTAPMTLRREDDLLSIVHEELDRLPERHRLPVVLCDLEGMGYHEAARQLRWSEPTLRHRLVAGRRRLRERLAGRGFQPALRGAAGRSVYGELMVIPAGLSRAVVALAGGKASSTAVIELTRILTGGMLMARFKIGSGLILVALALAATGVIASGARQAAGPSVPGRPQGPAQGDRSSTGPTAPGDARAPDRRANEPESGIEGRVVDLEGRPLGGVRVELVNLWSASQDGLARWLGRAQDKGVDYPSEGLSPGTVIARLLNPAPATAPTVPTANTDRDGRFQLPGVGPEQLAEIRVSGPTIATMPLFVAGRDGAEVRAAINLGLRPSQVVYHPRRFQVAAPPGKPIEGVVRDEASGLPLAGIVLRAAVFEEGSLIPAPGTEATTDGRGAFRIPGMPKAPAYRLFVEPRAGLPYPPGTLRVIGTPGFDPVACDLALKRGILIRGTVTDKITGRPVNAAIDVYAFEDNPHVKDFPGFRESNLSRSFAINGRYEALALPGRGLIGVSAGGYLVPYRTAPGAAKIGGYDSALMGFRTHPHFCQVANYNELAEINLDPKAQTATLDLQLDPGRMIEVTPVDPQGIPVAQTTAAGVVDLHPSSEYPQPGPVIKVHGLDPSRPRRLTVRHAGRGLIGSIYLRGDELGPLTLQLQPSGTIAGRLVDRDGRPRGGVGIISTGGSNPSRPAEQGILPGGDHGGGIRIGPDGTFRVEGLVPGLKYGGEAAEGFSGLGSLFQNVTVAPGEVKSLGDLEAISPKRVD